MPYISHNFLKCFEEEPPTLLQQHYKQFVGIANPHTDSMLPYYKHSVKLYIHWRSFMHDSGRILHHHFTAGPMFFLDFLWKMLHPWMSYANHFHIMQCLVWCLSIATCITWGFHDSCIVPQANMWLDLLQDESLSINLQSPLSCNSWHHAICLRISQFHHSPNFAAVLHCNYFHLGPTIQ